MSSAGRYWVGTRPGCSISKSQQSRARVIVQMAIVLAKTYQALKAAGAPEDDAIAAAEELAAYENRLTGIDNRLGGVEGRLFQVANRLDGVESRLVQLEIRLDHVENRLDHVENRLAVVETKVAELAGKMTVLTWAVGINAAATIAILGVLLRGHGSLP